MKKKLKPPPRQDSHHPIPWQGFPCLTPPHHLVIAATKLGEIHGGGWWLNQPQLK